MLNKPQTSTIHTYEIRNVHIPENTEFTVLGSVYVKNGDIVTENNNTYIDKRWVGSFILKNPSKNLVHLYLVEDVGDNLLCEYSLKSSHDIYYLNGYLNTNAIDCVYLTKNSPSKKHNNKNIVCKL